MLILLTYALFNAFSETNKLRDRNGAGLSSKSTARNEANSEANQRRRRERDISWKAFRILSRLKPDCPGDSRPSCMRQAYQPETGHTSPAITGVSDRERSGLVKHASSHEKHSTTHVQHSSSRFGRFHSENWEKRMNSNHEVPGLQTSWVDQEWMPINAQASPALYNASNLPQARSASALS